MSNKRKNPAQDALIKMFNPKNEMTELSENNTRAMDEIDRKWNMNDKIVDLFASSIEKDKELRGAYATILLVILGVELVALLVIFILAGLGILNYSKVTFNLFVTGGIAEVFVLVRVIVKYLFKDNITNALNIILERNNSNNTYKKFNKSYKRKNDNLKEG